VRESCADGCDDGACIDYGACGSACNTPPRPYCDDDQLVTFDPQGVCDEEAAACTYTESRGSCGENVCFEGECVEPSCQFVTCDTPPTARCDGDEALTYGPRGTCDDATLECAYAEFREDCTENGEICFDGQCVADPECVDVVCNTPDASFCDDTIAISFAASGTCAEGACTYEQFSRDCADDTLSCIDGECVDLCADIECIEPPAAECRGNEVVGYEPEGDCKDGTCNYTQVTVDCTDLGMFCVRGECIEDPACEGVLCNRPPVPFCDASVAVTYADDGECSLGSCSYEETRNDCALIGFVCEDAACVDPCDGVVCADPPQDYCEDNFAVYFSGAGECTDGNCGYAEFTQDCTDLGLTCVNGLCTGVCEDSSCTAPPTDYCDGTLAVGHALLGYCLDESCVYDEIYTECADNGETCFLGQCVPFCGAEPCIEPPAATCVGDVVHGYDPIGTCNGDSCAYTEATRDCAAEGLACFGGECVDPCFVTVCSTPPAPVCDGDVSVNYSGPGVCEEGECSYSEIRVDCREFGDVCNDGVCVDPCIGIICNDSPPSTCDGETALDYPGGICEFGACQYPATETDCLSLDLLCSDGDCFDPCIGTTCNDVPPDFCDGTEIVRYTGEAACVLGSCLYSESRSDCAAAGFLCQPAGETVECFDACEGVSCTTPPSDGCTEDVSRDFPDVGECGFGVCDYVPAADDCSARGAWCGTGGCQDACTDVVCPVLTGTECRGNVLVTYIDTPASCIDGACEYDVTEENCLAQGARCDAGACVPVADVCTFLDCSPRPASCLGDAVVTDSAAGSCDTVAGACDFSAVQTVTNCPAGQGCFEGSCRRAPAVGELVVSEIFYDATGSDLGLEWIELHNPTGNVVSVGGLELTNSYGQVLRIDTDFTLTPGDFDVIASSASAGVTADFVYDFGAFSLANGSDRLRVTRNGALLDEVFYGRAGWTDALNAALNLSSASLTAVANDVATNWCAATALYRPGTGALGTPGAANRRCP
jgi:hypothetical protein